MRPADRTHWKIASITGHRDLSERDRVRLYSAMKGLAQNPTIDAIYFGGAIGADTEALKSALEYRSEQRPWLVAVMPDVVEAQPSSTHQWARAADELIELKNPITSGDKYASYRIRNQYLVDVCSLLVAFWNGNYKSGTGSAVRMAEQQNKPVHRIPMGDL